MKLLIAIDGSASCLRALAYVVEHTSLFGTKPEMTLITVHRPIPLASAKAVVGKEVIDQYYHDEAEAVFAPARELLARHQRQAEERLVLGEPGHEIALVANSGYQMLVMGTHGRSEIANLFMGSAATRALAESTIPVLLVK